VQKVFDEKRREELIEVGNNFPHARLVGRLQRQDAGRCFVPQSDEYIYHPYL
jgi:hypothetical protein